MREIAVTNPLPSRRGLWELQHDHRDWRIGIELPRPQCCRPDVTALIDQGRTR